jgi:cytochrome c2
MQQMKLSPTGAGLLLINMLVASSTALAAGNATAGKGVFMSHCAVCHSTQPSVNKIGPSLAGVVGSKSGTVPGYDFSTAMKNADVTWDDPNLDKFLEPGWLCLRDQDVRQSPQSDRSAECHRLSQYVEEMSRIP